MDEKARRRIQRQIADYQHLLEKARSAPGDPVCACVAHWCTDEINRLYQLLDGRARRSTEVVGGRSALPRADRADA